MLVVVQLYSIIVSQVYNTPPRFIKGNIVLLGLNVVGVIALAILYTLLQRENKIRQQKAMEQSGTSEWLLWQQRSFEEYYDYHPMWQYVI